MPFTTPPTAVDGTAIASAHVNTLRDNDTWFNGLLQSPAAAGQVPISSSTSAATYGFLGTASIVDGAVTATQLATDAIGSTQIDAGAVDSTALDAAVVAKLPASGLGGWFRTAAEIPSGWARETALDGRIAVGDGTTFSVTFTEETSYGSSWSHSHAIETSSSAVLATSSVTEDTNFSGGGASSAAATHGHVISATTASAAPALPMRGYVAARKS